MGQLVSKPHIFTSDEVT